MAGEPNQGILRSDAETKQERRALGVSLMMPWKESARNLAESGGVDLDYMADASDEFIIDLMAANGFGRQDLLESIPGLALVPEDQRDAFLDAFGIERLFAENLRRGAREEDPLPLGFMVGDVIVDTTTAGPDFPIIWAVATKMSDPEALCRKLRRECRKLWGNAPSKDVSQRSGPRANHRFTPEQMVSMHDRGLPYKEIAIQSLRDEFPEIVEHPDRFKAEIKKERSRIIWVIRAARKLWSSRMPEDSIG